MKSIISLAAAALLLMIGAGCRHEAELNLNLSDKFEGKEVELITFEDSTTVARAMIVNGKASMIMPDSLELPALTLLTIDGRIRGYYVAEHGKALLTDSMRVASGTPLNRHFAQLMQSMDSVENLDDMDLYIKFAEQQYKTHRDSPFGNYFGLEVIKYADPEKVDSLLKTASPSLRDARRAQRFIHFSNLRKATAPGKPYADFAGEDASGKPIKISRYVTPGKYTIIDFWASWCPYCIKELPEMKEFYTDMKDKGVEIVGVAVRDSLEDTRAAVSKHGLEWPIVYNTGRLPYDIYGFSGIPHHILIGPDGKIISRGESIAAIRKRLEGK